MQIVSCQYFSKGGRIREDLSKINVETQTLQLVTSKKRVSLIANLKMIF